MSLSNTCTSIFNNALYKQLSEEKKKHKQKQNKKNKTKQKKETNLMKPICIKFS